MSPARPKLALHPELCDACGRCVERCRQGAIRVGTGYIFVDWERCDGCGACAAFCDREAILERDGQTQQVRLPSRGDVAGEDATADAGWGGATRKALAADGVLVVPSEPPAREATADGTVWSAGDAAAVIVISVALAVALQLALASDFVRTLSASGVLLARAGLLATYYVAEGAVLAALAWLRRKAPLAQAFSLDIAPPLGAWGAVAVLLVGTWLTAVAYRVAVLGIGWRPPAAADLPALFGSDSLGLTLTVLVVVLFGPFVEELALRGLVLPALARHYPLWGAIAGSAVLFAGLHASLWSLVPLTVLGLSLGWLTARYRSLWPAVALHVGYNAVLVAAAFWVAGRG